MANFPALYFVGFMVVVLTTGVDAKARAFVPSCPTYSGSNCYCYLQSPGIMIDCGYYATPEEVKATLEFYKPYGPIVALQLSVQQSSFSYVPDDFLADNQIPSVIFRCSHSHAVNGGMLSFSVDAFKNGTGVCGLSGNLTFSSCNIRQFDSASLTNCNLLEKLAFMDSHVESIIDIPTLESLKNFTVYYPSLWSGATLHGLSRMSLAPGASLPRLRYLDLTGNGLKDDSIQFIPQLTTVEELYLVGNNFSTVPDLTGSFDLHTFSMTLSSDGSVSIFLPNPRTQIRSLNATLISSGVTIYNVTSLEGMFVQDTINLLLNTTAFTEEVFFSPLSSSSLTINLNPAARFVCGCNISWLVRDNPALLDQVNNGTCADGRPFGSIPAEEVSCCSTQSLISRVSRQQKEIDSLKNKLHQLQFITQLDV